MAQNQQNDNQEFLADYAVTKKDVRKVIITNVIIIFLLLVLFFINRKTGFITNLTRFF